MPPSRESDHIPALDGLRGLAILLVLPHNLRLITEPFDLASTIWVQLLDRGWIGVQLFFVLSGFLITRILLDTRGASNYYSAFYARRALRIFPVYYVTLAVWLLVLPTLGWGVAHDTRWDIYYWLFLANWTLPLHFSGAGLSHFWSLAVEEQFYLVWPAAIRRLEARSVFAACLGMAVTSFLFRLGLLLGGVSENAVYSFTPSRMDALALGGAVAAVFADGSLRASLRAFEGRLGMAAGGILFIGAMISRGYRQFGLMPQTVGYLLLSVSIALWLWWIVARSRSSAVLCHTWLRKFGKYSFALYVFHVPAKVSLVRIAAYYQYQLPTSLAGDAVFVTLFIALLFALAALSYRLLEAPFLGQKQRFPYHA